MTDDDTAAIAATIALTEGLVSPPRGGRHWRMAEAVVRWQAEQEPTEVEVRRIAENPERAMDLWWKACNDEWAVPDDLPAKFLNAVLLAAKKARS